MLKVGSIVMGVSDVRRATAFWTEALGYVPRADADDTWALLSPASGAGPNVSLDLSETPWQERPRVHLDLYSDDQAAEVERLLGLGASTVDWEYPSDADFVVLADTEGNRFCVIAPG
ncbi:glyoxalase [Amycolatopsis antarctica]|uniref:Glyoxalase n=1 Tax=Amycolatopsis antarctica TaxID=1854586 RepID=A0A263D239_9PSEU|nr:VOC family protein [Amycolatopsis antarctica]OZM72532.1 glyoxalase [Amycolatopsis antarctica]